MVAPRLVRWALFLNAYDMSLTYKQGKAIEHADCLSRAPIMTAPQDIPMPAENILLLETLQESSLTFKEIAVATAKDNVLKRVMYYITTQWPTTVEPDLQVYFTRKEELHLCEGCVLWGLRVVIPHSLQQTALSLLHEDHLGMVKTKRLARGLCFWPNINEDIETQGMHCQEYQRNANVPMKASYTPWLIPEKPCSSCTSILLGNSWVIMDS